MSATGNSFTYKGYDFGGENFRCYVVGPVYQRMPEPRVNVHQFAQADGGVTQGGSFGMRQIRLAIKLVAPTPADRVTQLENVVGVLRLSQSEGPGDLSIDLFPGRLFKNAKLTSDLMSTLSGRMEEFTLEFICDPWPVASSATEVAGIAATNGVEMQVMFEGDLPIHTEWIIKNTSGSPAAGVALQNASFAGSAIWSNELAAGDWLLLNSQTQAASVSSDSGATWTDAPANLAGVIPKAQGGVENDITITGLDAELDISYTPGYAA